MKSLRELINLDEPGWPVVQDWIKSARCPVEVLPVDRRKGDAALLALQVTTRSPMGAIVYESGGLLVDHGWVRILGSGHPRLPRSLPDWNVVVGVMKNGETAPYLLVADDAVGGFFALEGGGLGIRPGHVAYFAPDTMQWESLDMGYSQFVAWSLSGDLAGFYADYRKPGWEREVKELPGDKAYSIAPPPVFKGDPFTARSWRAASVAELFGFYQDMGRQLQDVPDGGQVVIRPGPQPPGHS